MSRNFVRSPSASLNKTAEVATSTNMTTLPNVEMLLDAIAGAMPPGVLHSRAQAQALLLLCELRLGIDVSGWTWSPWLPSPDPLTTRVLRAHPLRPHRLRLRLRRIQRSFADAASKIVADYADHDLPSLAAEARAAYIEERRAMAARDTG